MWQKVNDIDGRECFVDFAEQVVVHITSSGLKHHFYDEILEIFNGDVIEREVKPSMDIYAGSSMEIVRYKNIKAELGRIFVDYVGNTIPGVPSNFEVFDVFHAFCAKIGYYHYADYPVDTLEGITDNWYNVLTFYHEGGYYEQI